MSANTDNNAAIWQSEEGVQNYVAKQDAREAKRRAQWRLMGELLPYGDDEAFTVLDIGAGTGPAARALLELFPNCTAILADFSDQMMDEGLKIMDRYDGRYRYVTFDMTSGDWPELIPTDLGAVVTSQCVHHINDLRKQQLFLEIYDHLRPGGWYLNFDPINTEDRLVDAAWQRANERQDPDAVANERNHTAEEQARYENHVRYMIPLEPQLEFVAEAGFESIDVYWKQLDYVIYGGSKPL
jgi:tRNA (cmo5U34)-methyltransferase